MKKLDKKKHISFLYHFFTISNSKSFYRIIFENVAFEILKQV